MYSEEELTGLRRKIAGRRWMILVPAALLAAGAVTAAVLRQELLTEILTILTGVLLIFAWDLFLRPLRCYERHMNQMLHGRLHEVEGDWAGMEDEISLVEGVPFHPVTLACTDEAGKPYERLLYYDAEKERPAILRGQRVRVTYSDRQIAQIHIL